LDAGLQRRAFRDIGIVEDLHFGPDGILREDGFSLLPAGADTRAIAQAGEIDVMAALHRTIHFILVFDLRPIARRIACTATELRFTSQFGSPDDAGRLGPTRATIGIQQKIAADPNSTHPA